MHEFEEDEFHGFCVDFEQNGPNKGGFGKGTEEYIYIINTYNKDTKEWKEAKRKRLMICAKN